MKRFIFLLFIILTLITVTAFADLREDEMPVLSADDFLPDISDALPVNTLAEHSAGAILMEAGSGQVLFENSADEKLPIASVTKIMTLLLTVEAIEEGKLKLEDTVTVSENAASMGGSQAFMEAGEKMTVHEMLKAVTVSSCNDGAVALAEHLAGSEDEFVKRMNERALALGMTSTEFVNCTGLDDENMHYSSARDVALMSRALISHPLIFDYTTIWMDTIRDGKFGLSNTNKLIRFYDGANGLKTGSTSKARFCLSATAKRDNMQLIAVVLGSPSSKERFAAAKGLLDYGFANYSVYIPKTQKIDPVRVWGGKKERVKLDFSSSPILTAKGSEGKIEEIVEINKDLKAPLKKGETVGKITYKSGDNIIFECEIKTAEVIEKSGFFDVLKAILSRVFYK